MNFLLFSISQKLDYYTLYNYSPCACRCQPTNQRILKYRYLCKNDFDKFDNEYVKKQIKTVFDIDLNEYDFDGTIIGLKEKLTSLEMDTVFPIRVDTGNDISIVIGIAKTSEGNFISVVGTYEVVEAINIENDEITFILKNDIIYRWVISMNNNITIQLI